MADELEESASEGGHFTGIHCGPGGADKHGDLELKLTVDGHEGSIWISQDFWIALGVKAGWVAPIFTEADYDLAMRQVVMLMEADPAEGTAGAIRLEALAGAIEQYEKVHYPIGAGVRSSGCWGCDMAFRRPGVACAKHGFKTKGPE